ncbi:MAG: dicarboxylate/amino acid:cation symporter, partial [Ignavibacteriae bacterium]|nr:dicarboxylate/amino acid:cation symporter [Ignavibacteriota bacterium]
MHRFFKSTTTWVLMSGILGYILSSIFGNSLWIEEPHAPLFYQILLLIKTVFISSLKMLIAPIVFFSLLGGILNIGEFSKLKRMGFATIGYYLATTVVAITIGLTAVFFVHPWKNSQTMLNSTGNSYKANPNLFKYPKKVVNKGDDSVIKIFTTVLEKAFVNPFSALTENNIIG